MGRWMSTRSVIAACFAVTAVGVQANDLFKCGNTFQDRACDNSAVQQRFSRTEGQFSIEQVNPDTDKDCARAARGAMGWWNRMAAGESFEQLKAEIQALNISRFDKSLLRDVLTSLRTYRGSPVEVRSQFESQCMAYKRRNGYATEREVANGAASLATDMAPLAPVEMRGSRAGEIEARRAEAAARRAAAEARAAAARSGRWP